MKKLIYLIACLTGVVWFASCSKETINDVPGVFAQADVIYSDQVRIVQFVNNVYTFIPRGYNRLETSNPNSVISGPNPVIPNPSASTSMVASATDEAVHATRNSAAERWGTGLWGPSPSTAWDDPIVIAYTGIRRTFVFTEEIYPNINEATMVKAERESNLGQILFLRALFNFELLKRYGGYPIVKNALAANGDLNIPKSSYDECVKYISDLCDEALPLLKFSHDAGNLGRATRGSALALKARLLLYAASPLNNPAAATGKWEAAADASAAVINLKDGTGAKVYDLYTTGTGYDAFFTTVNPNKEIIFSRFEVASNTIERLNGPVSITGGLGGTNPTLDLVNAYERIDGTPFDWNNPAHAANPFAGRDPRFAKSILYNGAPWMGITIETFEGGKDKVGNNATRTSFYIRKFLGPNARWTGTTGNANHCFPIFRYGETLLNYAEAMNEAYGPDADPKGNGMTARQAIALIRTRAGLTANQTVPAANDQAKMRTAVRNERRIELAFEEHRHLDVRRWKIAEQVLNQPVSGLKILKNSNGTFSYTPEVVEQRVFQPKMYLYPFPQEEISRNPALVQNTGW